MVDLSRRGFLGGLIAAPFVAKMGVLMPIKSIAQNSVEIVAHPDTTYVVCKDGWITVRKPQGKLILSVDVKRELKAGKLVLPNLKFESSSIALDFRHAEGVLDRDAPPYYIDKLQAVQIA